MMRTQCVVEMDYDGVTDDDPEDVALCRRAAGYQPAPSGFWDFHRLSKMNTAKAAAKRRPTLHLKRDQAPELRKAA